MCSRNVYRNSAVSAAVFIFAGLVLSRPAECREQAPFAGNRIMNPYENVNWDRAEHLHSFSHQHGGRAPDYAVNPEIFWDMGFRHFPFSNYYPSKPQPLPEDFRKRHPDALWAPNAEHHSALGASHFNTIDSYYATGHGASAKTAYRHNRSSPVEYEFGNLNAYDAKKPWLSIYRLDMFISGTADAAVDITS